MGVPEWIKYLREKGRDGAVQVTKGVQAVRALGGKKVALDLPPLLVAAAKETHLKEIHS